MSKYEALYEYLNSSEQDELVLSFTDVEKVLGFALPKSARVYRPWWGNQGAKSGHSHAMAWTNAGWQTCEVNMQGEKLKFVRVSRSVPLSSPEPTAQCPSKPSMQDKIIAFLKVRTEGASNKDIAAALDRSPPHVYQETALMERRGLLNATKLGKAKIYTLSRRPEFQTTTGHAIGIQEEDNGTVGNSYVQFESLARDVMSQYFQTQLNEGQVGKVPKRFDFLSSDKSIVGDSKFYTMVRGASLPPAKFATIAEYVWLLEKTNATTKFLVFGKDRRVPEEWLKRYGMLVNGVEFYFLDQDQNLDRLN